MALIAVLSSTVADQIAAGEVVERPASVVKELVENALDAGATSIDIAAQEGGRASVRISDDGTGMAREDAVLAVERHATSKIRTAADLVGVHSFGFRGEALPAIGSVARLEIDTATEDGAGTRVRVEGGTIALVGDVARRRGTTVSVTDLFFNVPARLKFLRGARSEWRAVMDVLTTMALTRRDVRFAIAHDGKPLLTLPPASGLRDRVAALWSVTLADALVGVDDVSGPIRVSGLVERPADVGTAARRVFVTVNGRAVRDTGVVRAAEAAYRSTIPAGVRPTVLLELELPGGEVDVNVHPAKAEVRFRDRWTVERAVERAVRRALGTEDAAAWFGSAPAAGGALPFFPREVDVEVLRAPAFGATDGSLFDAPAVDLASAGSTGADDAPEATSESAPVAPDPVVPPLFQLRRTFIAFEREDGLVLIDQHSAHERILYERFLGAMERGESPAQRLLFPLTLHLSPAEADAFDAHRDLLARLGFEAEAFGGAAVLVQATPHPHPRFDAERCLRDTLQALTGDREASVHSRHERLAATVACKAAIKAGDVLALGEMRALYLALAGTTLPAHDVHGRATIVHVSWDELERRFGRR
ncbi:MAG: DNA mismatch repair endonuclease MutL [Gemmatimonadota bacterium]|nr:DNA mismatch repair endonuclease MutL [Gemmatimonadota bacterium]